MTQPLFEVMDEEKFTTTVLTETFATIEQRRKLEKDGYYVNLPPTIPQGVATKTVRAFK